ncbi:hypothetical protein M422DRAFT_783130 [Sphaerobolus stellatus SS14]|uniref:AB hydrolase-1 domain-containing protein n=1 Tax=Sphaerobolus stellatus (strain SS14) TaxID=990650 RepID=A0A0C9UWA9_SPHS4|nr:hypothetical protein M422DRAFT_783130 [Sphaerobolus stellatus SS14]
MKFLSPWHGNSFFYAIEAPVEVFIALSGAKERLSFRPTTGPNCRSRDDRAESSPTFPDTDNSTLTPISMTFNFESYTFDWTPDYPFLVTAKRYWDPSLTKTDGYTLVFAHGNGFNKEQWESIIKYLFALSKNSTSFPIREAWAVDCPNQGDSAILNEQLLLRGGYDTTFMWDEYGKVLRWFLTQNRQVNFNQHKVIGIGHSMGAVAISITQSYIAPPKLHSIVLCEPMIVPTDIHMDPGMLKATGAWPAITAKRRDIWPSCEEAFKDFSSKKVYQVYHPDVLKAYVEQGLRKLPTALYPEGEGVTLKCTKVQEVACYQDPMTHRSVRFLTGAVRSPSHAFAAIVKSKVTDASTGREFASVTYSEKTGHLMVQMVPQGLAEAIFAAVTGTYTSTNQNSAKL